MKILWNKKDVADYLSVERKAPPECVSGGMDTHPAMLRSDAEKDIEEMRQRESIHNLSWVFAAIMFGVFIFVLL